MTADTPRLDNQLCFALYSASSALTAIYRPLLQEIDLTYPQFLVVMALWEQDNIPISSLATKTCLTNSTMTPLLKRLEQKGFISRQSDQSDERKKTIVLTIAGHDLKSRATDITQQAFCSTGLTKPEALTVISLCQKLVLQTKGKVTTDQ